MFCEFRHCLGHFDLLEHQPFGSLLHLQCGGVGVYSARYSAVGLGLTGENVKSVTYQPFCPVLVSVLCLLDPTSRREIPSLSVRFVSVR